MFTILIRNGRSLIFQVGILFTLCIILTGTITFVSQHSGSNQEVTARAEIRCEILAREAKSTIQEYPAYEWLLRYWYEHADELDIEYDEDYGGGEKNRQKALTLAAHRPDLSVEYIDNEDVKTLSVEDQKLYAEIVYAWVVVRLDQIKVSNKVKYLFCIRTDKTYANQFFMFSAAGPEEKRGKGKDQIYPLGMTLNLTNTQRKTLSEAKAHSSHLADLGKNVDYYTYLGEVDGDSLFIGMTITKEEFITDVLMQTIKGAFVAMGYQIILAAICSLGILILVLKPLRRVQRNIRRYKNTKDSGSVVPDLEKINMKNELGELAKDVIELTHEIDDYVEKIQFFTADQERIEVELNLAEQIQASMLPQETAVLPDRKEFDIHASMDPAREVGGDFFDFFMIDDDHLCLVIADVSGKGIPAALFMMRSMSTIKDCAMHGKSTTEILETANDALCENNTTEMFVTVWIGILEISTGKMTAANAGHEYPAMKYPNSDYEIVKDQHGFVLGALEGMKYKEYELYFEPGTSIFVYTDGLPEATNANEELFGTDRIIEALNTRPDADPKEVLEIVQTQVDAFVKDAEQFDDLTMLCLHYNGRK